MTKTPEELTEEWKAEKLEWGKDYYIKTVYDEVLIDCYEQQYDESHYPQGMGFDNFSKNMVKNILAPVPTYDEYKAMQDQIADLSKEVEELELNNKILEKCQEEDFGVSYLETVKTQRINKELCGLLKECRTAFEVYAKEDETCGLDENNKYAKHLLTRINAALNETRANPIDCNKIQESEER